jgi:hypothetical protein
MANQVWFVSTFLVSKGDRAMSLENAQRLESINHYPGPRKEYRIKDGKVEAREARVLDRGTAHDDVWSELSPAQLSSHVRGNTPVARWLERSLGWRRLLRACVGQ